MASQQRGKITDQRLESLRDEIGEVIDEPHPHNTDVTTDGIRHWLDGIGDDNPLYLDKSYAESGPYGGIVAPPTYLYTTTRTGARRLPGVHAMYAGDEWRWYEPVYPGYEIDTVSRLKDLVELDTDYGGRSVKQIYTIDFYNQFNDHLASRDVWFFRVEREQARDQDKYEKEGVELAEWNEDEIGELWDHYRSETPRGDEPRYFEDVDEGDTIETLLKGPLTITGGIKFLMGWGASYMGAHRLWVDMLDEHPALSNPNHQGVPSSPARVHWDREHAQRVGLVGPYDYGPERPSWFAHAIEHWMGDHGFLTGIRAELRRPNFLGDVTWIDGTVTDKRVDGDQHVVELEVQGRNQRDEVSTKGSATAVLPTRDGSGVVPGRR